MSLKDTWHLVHEKNRLETFKNWQIEDTKSCAAAKMAEAGFYYIGENDSDAVRCFLCQKELDGWNENDDPWKEHISHSAICEFAKTRKAENALSQEELLHFYSRMLLNTIQKMKEEFAQEKRKIFMRDLNKLTRRLKK